jgi:hypothetical protein
VGTLQRCTLSIALLATAQEARANELEVGLALGVPFSTLHTTLALGDHFAFGARADLVETHALRFGLRSELRWIGEAIAARTTLDALRAFGLDAQGSWDLELMQTFELDIVEHFALGARAGVIGYYGELPSQRGLLGVAAARAIVSAGEWRFLLDGGWIADRHHGRPLASLGVARSF